MYVWGGFQNYSLKGILLLYPFWWNGWEMGCGNTVFMFTLGNYPKTRMKTSIRYAKENDREKRERRRERERKVEGEI